MVTQTVIVGDLTTGRRLMALPVSSASWATAAGDHGSIAVTLPLTASDFQTMSPVAVAGGVEWRRTSTPMRDVRTVTEPLRAFIAILADDRVIAAGPIIGRRWADDGTRLDIRGIGMSWIFTRRRVIPASYTGRVQDASLDYTSLSLGTIQKRLVQVALARPNGTLPIVLPADEAGAHERHYLGFELGEMWDRIDQLSKVLNGPEVAFQPRLTTDRLGVEWVMRTGTNADPLLHQTGMDWTIDLSVPRGVLGGLTVDEDGQAITNLGWATGSGMDTALLIGSATDATAAVAGYPLLESVRSYGSVTAQGTLQGHAASDVDANRRPWQTWSMRVMVDDRLGQYRNGDWWSVRIGRNHPYLDEGVYRSRMASHRGSITADWVDITLVPTMGG